jgi:hypothetical protein
MNALVMTGLHGDFRLGIRVLMSITVAIIAWVGVMQPTARAQNLTVAYTPYRFEANEGWWLETAGDGGESKLEGKALHFDFSRGATAVALALPDRTLLTRPVRLRLRIRGDAQGHPARVQLHTHFMTFSKTVGPFVDRGDGIQELVFDAPPGPGWEWSGGENDGKLHGPLRLGRIALLADGKGGRGSFELRELIVEGECPEDRRCVLTADLTAGEAPPVMQIEARSLAAEPVDGKLTGVFRDWEGHEIGRFERNVTLRAGGELESWREPMPQIDARLRFVEATCELEIPGQTIAPARASWVAPISPRGDTRLQPESPFGMGIYLNRLSGDEQKELAERARDAGVKWSREDFSWERIEPRPGAFHWDFYDGLLGNAISNGISVYAIVGYWTHWSKSYTSEGIDQYVAFLRQLVRRYKDRIHHWEIWNEPNIFFWQGPKELYAEMLAKSYAAVKEEDPAAQVLGISTAGIDHAFIDRMLKLKAPFDVLTIHPYRRTLEDGGFIADLKKASDQVRLPDGTRRPVWLTEMGWTTNVPHHVLRQDFEPVSERVQAELIARTYLCSIVSGVEPRTFWYNFRNDGDDPHYFEHHLGILRRDGRPKPAYRAYATLSSVLEGMVHEGAVEAADGVFAHRFRAEAGDGRMVTALWHPSSRAEITLPVARERVRVTNAIGEWEIRESQTTGAASGMRTMTLTLQPGAPVYVSEDR